MSTQSVFIPACFHLAQTLDCGQAFRWQPCPQNPDVWEGTAFGRFLTLRQAGGALELRCPQEDFTRVWRSYFDLDTDYEAIRAALAGLHPNLRAAAEYAPGIRILRQEPWEALCSFVLSQNNNILRIKGIIRRFCQLFGQPLAGGAEFGFPPAEAIASLAAEDLAPLHAGYRAPYVLEAARAVAVGSLDLERIAREPAGYGREELRKIRGVGPKVAECVLLYGFHKTECFPLDVWMKRAMAVLLPGFTPEDLGPHAGIAQQYLFHYSRTHPELFA